MHLKRSHDWNNGIKKGPNKYSAIKNNKIKKTNPSLVNVLGSIPLPAVMTSATAAHFLSRKMASFVFSRK